MDYHSLVATNMRAGLTLKFDAVSEDLYYFQGTIRFSVLPLKQVARVLVSLTLTFHTIAAKFV